MSTWPALEDPLESTRVFELLPALTESDKIELRLHVVNISGTSTNSSATGSFLITPLEYEAISYTWGGQIADRQILLDGHVYMIRQNLWHCLHRFRRQDRSRMLWADSISINQEDDVEKGHQVSIIGKIFRRATRVLAWIGEDKEEGEEEAVMENVLKTTVRPGSLVPYGGCAQLLRIAATTVPRDQPSRQRRWARSMRSRLRGKSLTSISNMVAYDPRRKNYEALVREWSCLTRRTFWTRRWIIQELVLARDLVICCGDAQVGWNAFIEWFTYISEYLWDSSITDSWYPSARQFLAVTITGMNRDAFLQSRWNLFFLLYNFDYVHCSDRRDKVYALLPLATASPVSLPGSDQTATRRAQVKDEDQLQRTGEEEGIEDKKKPNLTVDYTIDFMELYFRTFEYCYLPGPPSLQFDAHGLRLALEVKPSDIKRGLDQRPEFCQRVGCTRDEVMGMKPNDRGNSKGGNGRSWMSKMSMNTMPTK